MHRNANSRYTKDMKTRGDMKRYLQQVRRHKRTIAAARALGTATGYGLMYLLLFGILGGLASLAWYFLTGAAPENLTQVVGLLLLVMVSVGATELLRPRKSGPHPH